MSTWKNFAQMSTDMFVRFNEQVAERMKDMNIDTKYSDELLGFVHHVRDRNDFFLELADFWNTVQKEIKDDVRMSDNETIMEALQTLNEESRKIYSRKAEEEDSKAVNWLSGMEKYSDEMMSKFLELGLNYSGAKKSSFESITNYAEEFQKLEKGENSGDYTLFNACWDEFQTAFLKSNLLPQD